jgi:hypothetical protein
LITSESFAEPGSTYTFGITPFRNMSDFSRNIIDGPISATCDFE